MKGENKMNFPKSILVIKYFPYYKNSEGPDYLPIGIISVENAKEFFWENGKKGDDSNACITFEFIHKDRLGHILIEVYMELDDGGNYSSHNCCFYLNTEIGLLEKFCQKLPTLKRELLGIEVVLNDND